MLKEELKKIKGTKKELRNFGILVGAVLVTIAGLRLRTSSMFLYLISIGMALTLLGLVAPKLLKYPYKAWMTLALIIGKIMTTIILSIPFILGFFPLGIIVKLSGKELIDTKINKSAQSYWQNRETKNINKEQYEKQY